MKEINRMLFICFILSTTISTIIGSTVGILYRNNKRAKTDKYIALYRTPTNDNPFFILKIDNPKTVTFITNYYFMKITYSEQPIN